MGGNEMKSSFKAVENSKDTNEYVWTIVGLTPYTKYKFRVLILLMGSNSDRNSMYLHGDIDFESASYIVTQPSLVVRTFPSEKGAPSKPIIVSVQQVRNSSHSVFEIRSINC